MRLDQEIAAAGHPVERAALQARKALYLGRQGQREEAEALIAAVRQAFEARPVAEVTAWVSLAEAVTQRTAGVLDGAHDRMRRAYALSQAINHPKLMPLCSAWLANFEFNARNVSQAAKLALDALTDADDDHQVLARADLVVADLFNLADRIKEARPWYAKAREHALAEGDEGTLSALMFNASAMHLDNLRIRSALTGSGSNEVSQVLLEAESTGNYDSAIGVTSLAGFVPLQRAIALIMLGRFGEARDLFDENIELADEEGMSRRKSYYYAERALCSFKLGDLERTRQDMELATQSVVPDSDVGDLAPMHAVLAQILEGLGETEASTKHRNDAAVFHALHLELQAKSLEALKDFPPPA